MSKDSFITGPKIYSRDASSFFAWNRRLGANLQPKKYLDTSDVIQSSINTNVRPSRMPVLAARAGPSSGKGIKNVTRQDSSQFTQDRRANAVSKVNLNEDNNKSYDTSFVKSKLRRTRSLGTVAPPKKAANPASHCVTCKHN